MKNTEDFCYEGKPSCATTKLTPFVASKEEWDTKEDTVAKLTPFTASKDEWDTKEDTGKSMKNALYVLQYAKRHVSG